MHTIPQHSLQFFNKTSHINECARHFNIIAFLLSEKCIMVIIKSTFTIITNFCVFCSVLSQCHPKYI